MPPLFSCYQLQILIYCRTAQITHSRKLAHIHLLRNKSRIMLVKHSGDIILRCRFAAYLFSILNCVLHPALDSSSYYINENNASLSQYSECEVKLKQIGFSTRGLKYARDFCIYNDIETTISMLMPSPIPIIYSLNSYSNA